MMKKGIDFKYVKDNFEVFCVEAFEKAKFNHIEVTWYKYDELNKEFHSEYIEQILYLKDKYNLTVSVHVPTFYDLGIKISTFREILYKHMEEVIDYAASIGAETIVIHPGTIGQMDIPETPELPAECKLVEIKDIKKENAKRLTIEILKFMSEKLKNYPHITLTVENLILTNEICYTAAELNDLIKDLNCPNVKVCFDAAHAHRAQQNLKKFILDLGENLHHIHISDNNGKCDLHAIPNSEGCNIDWDEMFNTLHDRGYKNAIISEAIITKPSDYTIISNFLEEHNYK